MPGAVYAGVSFFFFTSSLLRGSVPAHAQCEAVAFVVHTVASAPLHACPPSSHQMLTGTTIRLITRSYL